MPITIKLQVENGDIKSQETVDIDENSNDQELNVSRF